MKTYENDIRVSALYVISMTVAFTARYGDYQPDFYLWILIGTFWILFSVLQLYINGFKSRKVDLSDIKWLIKLYLVPHIVVHLYTLFLMFTGNVSWGYFTSNATVYVPTLLAILSVYLFGVKAFKYNCIALFGSWWLSVVSSMLMKGIAIFPHAIIQAYFDVFDTTGGLTINYLELHDLVLAVGYIVVFYIFSNSKLTREKFFSLFFVFLIMGLGMKRVALLGLILTFMFHIVLKRLTDEQKYRTCLISGGIAFLICYLFIYILSSGNAFYDFVTDHGINVMGRNYYYQAIMKYAEFKPAFVGIGRNVITQILNNELSYLKVGGVHSDIIKMYVENGFILFGIWLWYYLVYVTKAYKKRFGIPVAVMYFGLTIYKFTLYVTDNVEIYFICQIFSILIVVTYALERKTGKHDKTIDKQNNIPKPLLK